MLGRRFISFFRNSSKSIPPSSASAKPVGDETFRSYGRKAVSFILITVTGGVALSALDDLAIYHSCSRKALEKVYNSREIKDAIGEPIVKGPWYNASLVTAHKRQSVACTFPISGPQGTGVVQLKAVRNGEGTWFPIFLPLDWDIVILNALVHIPGNDERNQTLRINVSDLSSPPNSGACTDCKPRELEGQEKNEATSS